MAENVTIARPYADAAFKLAVEGNALGAWQGALDRLATIASNEEVQACIKDPKLASSALAQLLTDVAGGLTPEQQNFVQVLADNDRLSVLSEIRDQFVLQKNAHEGVRDAVITSAFPLDDATLATLKSDLEARFQCKLNVSVSTDPALIGGVTIAVGDDVIDASVRGKLATMAAALKN